VNLTLQETRKIIARRLKVKVLDFPLIVLEEDKPMEITIDKLTAEQLKQFNPHLYKEIVESVDKDQALVDLQAKVEEMETDAKKQKTEKDALEQKVQDLETEKDQLEKDKDKLEVAEALRTKKEKIDELLRDSKLPKEAISDTFRNQLEKAEGEEEMKQLIDDRKDFAASGKAQVTNSGDEFDAEENAGDEKKGTKPPTDSQVEEAREAFTSRRVVSEVPDEK